MIYYNLLIDLLKTLPSVKEDLEQLRFGCQYMNKVGGIMTFVYRVNDTIHSMGGYTEMNDVVKIIGNPLQERHLRTFFIENDINFEFGEDGLSIIQFDENGDGIFEVIEIDNSVDFSKQQDSFYQEIYTTLLKF